MDLMTFLSKFIIYIPLILGTLFLVISTMKAKGKGSKLILIGAVAIFVTVISSTYYYIYGMNNIILYTEEREQIQFYLNMINFFLNLSLGTALSLIAFGTLQRNKE